MYAHAKTEAFLSEQFGQLQQILYVRGMRLFGTCLSENYLLSSAIGPGLHGEADLLISVAEPLLKDMALGLNSPVTRMATGRLKVEDNKILLLKEFFDLFK